MCVIEKIKNKLSVKQAVFELDWYIANSRDVESIINSRFNEKDYFEIFVIKNIYLISKYGIKLNKILKIIKDNNYNNIDIESCIDYLSKDINFSDKKVEVLEGEYLPLLGPKCNLINNWFLEYLPQVLIAENIGYKGNYIINSKKGFIFETLILLGIDENRLINDFNLKLETMYITETINIKDPKYLTLIEKLRNKLYKENYSAPERIYITKRYSDTVDDYFSQKELNDLLEKFSFSIIFEDELNFSDRLNLISNAKTIIINNQSSYIYSLFIKEKANIIDLCSPSFINNDYIIPILKLLKHSFYHLSLPNKDALIYEDGYNYTSSIEMLRVMLKNLFS
ncbi:MAG: hypothetical protein ACK4IX_05660 [Candidatus Sericytochromatia bacterium]